MMSDGNAALVNTNAFEQFAFLFHEETPSDGNEYVQVLGVIKNKRASRWIRRDYVTGPRASTSTRLRSRRRTGRGRQPTSLASR